MAKLKEQTKFAKIDSYFASLARIFGNARSLSAFYFIVLRFHVFWQREVIELFSYQCASVARIFGNLKSLSSFHIIVLCLYVFLATQSHLTLFVSFCFGCVYFWQYEVTEFLSFHYASVARIFGNTKSLNSLSFHCALVAHIFGNKNH